MIPFSKYANVMVSGIKTTSKHAKIILVIKDHTHKKLKLKNIIFVTWCTLAALLVVIILLRLLLLLLLLFGDATTWLQVTTTWSVELFVVVTLFASRLRICIEVEAGEWAETETDGFTAGCCTTMIFFSPGLALWRTCCNRGDVEGWKC